MAPPCALRTLQEKSESSSPPLEALDRCGKVRRRDDNDEESKRIGTHDDEEAENIPCNQMNNFANLRCPLTKQVRTSYREKENSEDRVVQYKRAAV